MKYNVIKAVQLGEKTFQEGESFELTEQQLGQLSEEVAHSFTDALATGSIVEDAVAPVEPGVPNVSSMKDNEGKEPAGVGQETKSSADAPAPSAKDSGQGASQPWVGKHTIGSENVRPGGSLTTRDPKLASK